MEILKGCAQAVAEYDLDVMLTGREAEIRRVAEENEISLDRMELVDTPDTVSYTHLSAACKANGVNYSTFMNGLKKANIELNRKMLSEIAIADPAAFTSLVEKAKAAL